MTMLKGFLDVTLAENGLQKINVAIIARINAMNVSRRNLP